MTPLLSRRTFTLDDYVDKSVAGEPEAPLANFQQVEFVRELQRAMIEQMPKPALPDELNGTCSDGASSSGHGGNSPVAGVGDEAVAPCTPEE